MFNMLNEASPYATNYCAENIQIYHNF